MDHHEQLTIPSAESATDSIDSTVDLRQRWRALMGPLGFGERLLRFAFVGPDRCLLKVLSEVPIGMTPTRADVDNLMSALSMLVADLGRGHTVALLLTRPGRGGISASDGQWSAALFEGAVRFGVPIEPIFRANDDNLALVEPA